MTNLQRFDQDGIEIFVDTRTGESFASVSGYARMANKDKSTISRRLKGVAQNPSKTAEIQTVTGIKTVALVPEDLIAEWLPTDNPAMATQLMKLGVRVFLHKVAGYKVSSTAVQTPQTYLEALKALVAAEEEKELLRLEKQILEEENNTLAEAVDELFDYSSIIRVAKHNNCSEKKFNWRRLKAASIAISAEVKKVPCPRFGSKNLYSHDAWRVAYPWAKLPETTTLVVSASPRLAEGGCDA